ISQHCTGEKLDNVLVIFVAKREGKGPQEIVGWYRDARVYCEEKREKIDGRWRTYFATTKSVNACLLRPNLRRDVPNKSIGMGRADISYVYEAETGKRRALPGLAELV